MRDSMVFYRSFYEAVRELPDKEFAESVKAILDYGLDGVECETPGIAKALFTMARPQIDVNNKRYENGRKGGKPKSNQTVTKDEPNRNQDKPSMNQSKPNAEIAEPNANVNVNDNVNANVNDKEIGDKRAKRFIPPTLTQVQEYCAEKGYGIDCERFIDFYESKGWMIGKNKMKDWKAAVRTWTRSQRQEVTAKGNPISEVDSW